jgi:EAL and modified HD-GYP domain-containing signal transduction protein
MKVFVARQPIFDIRQRVVAYELLFRSGPENFFPNVDGDIASSRVINDSLMTFGLAALVGNRKVYVNVTRRVLCEELYAVLPIRKTVIELLETIEPDEQTVAACRELKRSGYELALDDYVDRPAMDPLVALADVIKVDFLATSSEGRTALRERLPRRKPALLAEKVESAAVFREARDQGYAYFQGYFFQRPEMVSRNEIPGFKLNHLEFLRELQSSDLNFDRLEKVIRRDVSLSVKLLRFLNSAAFYWRSKVTSLKSALVLLGERPFRKWASLIAIVGIVGDGPAELVTTCLARAHFCETLCRKTGRSSLELDGFLVGMLSAIDTLVGRPLQEILQEIAVSADIEEALLRTVSPLGKMRGIIMAYEGALWDDVASLARALSISEADLPDLYRESLEWANQALPR